MSPPAWPPCRIVDEGRTSSRPFCVSSKLSGYPLLSGAFDLSRFHFLRTRLGKSLGLEYH